VTTVAKDVQITPTALRTALAKRLGKHRFDLWFGRDSVIEIAGSTVRISLPNLLFQRWVANQFREEIVAACQEILGFCPAVEFLLAESGPREDSLPRDLPGQSGGGNVTQRSPSESDVPSTQESSCPPAWEIRADSSSVLNFPEVWHRHSCARTDSALAISGQAAGKPFENNARSNPLGDRENGQAELQNCSFLRQVDASIDKGHPGATPPKSQRPSSEKAKDLAEEPPALFPGFLPERSLQEKAGRSSRLRKRPSPEESAFTFSAAALPSRNGRTLLRFSDFAVGPCNQLAYTAARTAASHPGHVSPLFLFGPTSVGKTHLLQAICAETRQQHPGLIALYVWAEEFTTGFLEALRGGGLPSFRHKYRHVDVLAIDDIQFLLGKRCTQRELLCTIDTLLREGKQVVLASDRRPEELAEFGEDFIARLQSGIICELKWPDEEIRLPLVHQLCRRLGLELDGHVQEYVAAQVQGHARELLGALRRIQAVAHFRRKSITLELAQEALSDLLRGCARLIRLKDVSDVICDTFGLQPDELAGPSRAQHVTQPRLLAMWLARKYTRAGLNEISRFFGRRSHSVVISAQQKVERWLAEGKLLAKGGHTVAIQELIKELERRLKAS